VIPSKGGTLKQTLLSKCYARREIDEYYCHACNLRWPVNESKPDIARCNLVSRDTTMGASSIHNPQTTGEDEDGS